LSCVSVIIPVFNRARVLPRAIDSVLAQDLQNFELIVVDDRSSDGSADVARGYDDRRARVIELAEHAGSNAARNAGIRAAHSDLIAFLDSDDEYLPGKLSTIVRIFDARMEVDCVVDSFVKLVPKGSGMREVSRSNPAIEDREQFRSALFTRRLWKATPAIAVRRAAALKVGMFDERLPRLQDFDFLIRLSECARCIAIDEVLWIKHLTPTSISVQDTTLVASYVELFRRHPSIATRPYRRGMARDVTRVIRRSILRGRMRQAAADLRRLRDAFGWRRTAILLGEGQRGLPAMPAGLAAAPPGIRAGNGS
jgi:glycosyltransferase involved in cell wall biosynthesis